jgi:hypothetical protein
MYASNRSSWDFLNPSNWVINKPLTQNLQELSIGTQIMGTVIPEAVAYKAAQGITAGLVTKAASTGASAAVGGAGGATATIGGAGAVAALGLAGTGLQVGGGLLALEWLKKNWWIAALLLGGYILLKQVEKK